MLRDRENQSMTPPDSREPLTLGFADLARALRHGRRELLCRVIEPADEAPKTSENRKCATRKQATQAVPCLE